MSLVKVAGNASGTGTLTIQAPNTNTNYTLDLPAAAGTIQLSGNAISGTTGTFSGTISGGSTIGVGGATPANTGAGITFPATQSASSDANTLDDYEEGTWTPTAAGGTGSLTAYTSTGRYIKIGKNVYCWGAINVSNIGTAGGSFVWGGAPFTSFDNGFTTDPRVSVFLVREDNSTGTAYQGFMSENSTSGAFLTLTNNPVTWANNTTWVFCFTYIAA